MSKMPVASPQMRQIIATNLSNINFSAGRWQVFELSPMAIYLLTPHVYDLKNNESAAIVGTHEIANRLTFV
ncbi:MAG: hypothetical protein R8K20_02920 [Gallionellaceae bacterium]